MQIIWYKFQYKVVITLVIYNLVVVILPEKNINFIVLIIILSPLSTFDLDLSGRRLHVQELPG